VLRWTYTERSTHREVIQHWKRIWNTIFVGDVFTLDGGNGKLDLWQIKRVGGVDVPYWDVKVDASIIANHGDLWNERAQAMMAAIFRMSNPMLNPKAKPRANLHKQADFSRLQSPPR